MVSPSLPSPYLVCTNFRWPECSNSSWAIWLSSMRLILHLSCITESFDALSPMQEPKNLIGKEARSFINFAVSNQPQVWKEVGLRKNQFHPRAEAGLPLQSNATNGRTADERMHACWLPTNNTCTNRCDVLNPPGSSFLNRMQQPQVSAFTG